MNSNEAPLGSNDSRWQPSILSRFLLYCDSTSNAYGKYLLAGGGGGGEKVLADGTSYNKFNLRSTSTPSLLRNSLMLMVSTPA